MKERGYKTLLEQVMRIELTSSAWKADIIAIILYLHIWCSWPDSNRHGFSPRDFKSLVSTYSTTRAYIEKKGATKTQ